MNEHESEQEGVIEVIDRSRARTREDGRRAEAEQPPTTEDVSVIDASRARVREKATSPDVRGRISEGVQAANRRRWEADAAQSVAQLLAAGVSPREAERRHRTAKKRLREIAAGEKLLAAFEERQPEPGRTSPLEAD